MLSSETQIRELEMFLDLVEEYGYLNIGWIFDTNLIYLVWGNLTKAIFPTYSTLHGQFWAVSRIFHFMTKHYSYFAILVSNIYSTLLIVKCPIYYFIQNLIIGKAFSAKILADMYVYNIVRECWGKG